MVQLAWAPQKHRLPLWLLLVGVVVGGFISTWVTLFSLANQIPWGYRPYPALILGTVLLSRMRFLWKDTTGNFWTSLVATQLMGFGLMDFMVAQTGLF
ncbi:hypothetical protein [Deinococcus cellulosilyticus]|uniref:Uncharacterized protein n=1 Tax=Deinococcus cellulosilyticus (strain DSM 18568 / NBRC 106333 / KACC 11606 / 5516J-15) TaxID=1223518 RepID=A0A511N9A3_DEIC1|nr:hypothetical protein [Deinococcus cellulosilyticus]GEM49422.1 hypothetical protein DC3_50570 [Deinococcus cellulosilyticus NBRC 106333 = KACC 11606]